MRTSLERFDQGRALVRGMDDPPIGEGNRLTVFVLPTVAAVAAARRATRPSSSQGFYEGRASGSSLRSAKNRTAKFEGSMNADIIFFHEYAHHLMFQIIDRPLPEWVVEGFAEFMSTVRFEKNGDIGIGAPANHRAWGLFGGDRLPLATMLSGNYDEDHP